MRYTNHRGLLVGAIISAVLLCSFVITPSCSRSPKKISETTILKAFNHSLTEQETDQNYVGVQTGTYECNDPVHRQTLMKLDAAGLINYQVERYAWWEKEMKSVKKPYTVTKRAYFGTYNTTEYRWIKEPDYHFCDHYVVSVSLTKKGERLAISNLRAPKEWIDKDLQQPDIDPARYVWNQTNLTEDWLEIPNPFVDATSEKNNPDKGGMKSVSVRETTEQGKAKGSVVERIDSLKYKAFNQLVFESDTVYFLSHRTEGIKARNIQIFNILGTSTANTEVICRVKNVTDAGRIISGVENNQRSLKKASFSYYYDKGWIMDDEFLQYNIFE